MLLQAFDFDHLLPGHWTANSRSAAPTSGATSRWASTSSARSSAATRMGPDVPADHQGRRHQVRQDRGRRRLARPAQDQPLSLLPVLRAGRGHRRNQAPEHAHLRASRGSPGAGSGGDRQPRRPLGPETPGSRSLRRSSMAPRPATTRSAPARSSSGVPSRASARRRLPRSPAKCPPVNWPATGWPGRGSACSSCWWTPGSVPARDRRERTWRVAGFTSITSGKARCSGWSLRPTFCSTSSFWCARASGTTSC